MLRFIKASYPVNNRLLSNRINPPASDPFTIFPILLCSQLNSGAFSVGVVSVPDFSLSIWSKHNKVRVAYARSSHSQFKNSGLNLLLEHVFIGSNGDRYL